MTKRKWRMCLDGTLSSVMLSFVTAVTPCVAETSGAVFAATAYGQCVWDAHHDIGPCVQTAINEAAKRGGVVEIPHGAWLVGGAIQAASNVSLEGAAGGATLVPAPGNQTNPVLLRSFRANQLAVENLTFDGGGADFANANPIIAVTVGSHVVFDHVVVQNTHGIGLLLQGGVSESGVRNSRFVNLGNHWKATHAAKDRIQGVVFCCGEGNRNNFAQNNSFSDIGLDALQFSNQDDFTASNNTFLLENHEHSVVSAPDFPAAIFPLQSTNSKIDGNTIRGSQGNGIDAPGLSNTTISNNKISESNSCGIALFMGYDKNTQSEHVYITNNVITDNVRSGGLCKGGIAIGSGSPHDIVLAGNTVMNTKNQKTQTFALQIMKGAHLSNLTVGNDNKLIGAGPTPISREDSGGAP